MGPAAFVRSVVGDADLDVVKLSRFFEKCNCFVAKVLLIFFKINRLRLSAFLRPPSVRGLPPPDPAAAIGGSGGLRPFRRRTARTVRQPCPITGILRFSSCGSFRDHRSWTNGAG